MTIYRDVDIDLYTEDIEEYLEQATNQELKDFLEIIHRRYEPTVDEASTSKRSVYDITVDEQLNKLRDLPLETIDKIVKEYAK